MLVVYKGRACSIVIMETNTALYVMVMSWTEAAEDITHVDLKL